MADGADRVDMPDAGLISWPTEAVINLPTGGDGSKFGLHASRQPSMVPRLVRSVQPQYDQQPVVDFLHIPALQTRHGKIRR